jgi:hypothetical protein
MSMKPLNISECRPENRYHENVQNYHFDVSQGDELRLVREDGAELVAIPELGISAGALKVDHVSLTFHGAMFVRAWCVTHKPNEGRNGVIEIHTIFDE